MKVTYPVIFTEVDKNILIEVLVKSGSRKNKD